MQAASNKTNKEMLLKMMMMVMMIMIILIMDMIIVVVMALLMIAVKQCRSKQGDDSRALPTFYFAVYVLDQPSAVLYCVVNVVEYCIVTMVQ